MKVSRAQKLFEQRNFEISRKTDKIFGVLFILQWIMGIVFALTISPQTWQGDSSSVHIHVYAAIFLGGITAAYPCALMYLRPGGSINRYVVAISQIMFSILFIHLTGGRIETHFHVFGSLAFLAFYRDWKVLAVATLITAVDHVLRGIFWPQSVYGVLTATPFRALEHAAWVLFEDVFLYISIRNALEELRLIAEKQADLEEINEKVELANKTKSLFLANVSHELRTPIHGMLSFSSFGKNRMDTETKEVLKSYFEEIYDSGVRIKTLLDDLLDLTKLEAGKVAYSIEEEDLCKLTAIVLAELRALVEERGLKTKLTSSSPKVITKCDGGRFLQVIRNLISNAIKFSNTGSTIEIVIEADKKAVRYRVINSGVGIPDTELEAIFDKFIQSSKTRTGAGGTGLGLAICKEIISQHNGTIRARSTPDGKTEFIIELPADSTSEQPAKSLGTLTSSPF